MSPLIPTDSSSVMVSNMNQNKFGKKFQKTPNVMPNSRSRSLIVIQDE